MKERVKIATLFLFVLTAIGVGLGLAVASSTSKEFWSGLGFTLLGLGLGAAAAIFVVNIVINEIQSRRDDRRFVRTIEHVGGEALAAIWRLFPLLTYEQESVSAVWPKVVAGQLDLKSSNFGESLRTQLSFEQFGPRPGNEHLLLLDQSYRSDGSSDFQVALALVTRALGRAYANSDVIPPAVEMFSALEWSKISLAQAHQVHVITNFEASSLLAHLIQVAEQCSDGLLHKPGLLNYVSAYRLPKNQP